MMSSEIAPVSDMLKSLITTMVGYKEEAPLDAETCAKLIQSKQVGNTVDAELLREDPSKVGKQAFSMWPGAVEVSIPEAWKVGEKVPAQGPHGRIFFELPETCQPGARQVIHVKPVPDMRVEVPPGLKEGQAMLFQREDGTKISIVIPEGKHEGDTFDVVPPAAMVLVPEDAKAGDIVCFPMPGPPSRYWFRAEIPEELQLGKYFAARLPPPDALARVRSTMEGEKPVSPTAASETTSTGATDAESSEDSSPC